MNQSVADRLKGVSRAVLTAVIAFVVAVVVFATTSFAQVASTYKVEICVDDNSFTIMTNEKEPIEILAQANIKLSENDKLDISKFYAGEGGIINVDKQKTVNVSFNKTIKSYSVYADTVGDVISELGLSATEKSGLNYSMTESVVDGMVINIKSAKSTTLVADGKKVKYAITKGTVADLIELAQIELGEDDYTQPSLNTKLKSGMTVKVMRVEYKEQTKSEKVSYKTVKQENPDLYQGIQKVVSNGTKGTAKVTYKVKYVNGKETTKTEVSRKIVKQAKNRVVEVGTKATEGTTNVKSNGVTTKNGYYVGQEITGRYTHYCACGTCGSGTGITASGKRVRNGMSNPYYIACNWLPLGSVVNIDGTNYTVADRGGSGLSTVGRVDIFTPEGHKACYRYGTGSCSLTIVRLGW